MSYLSRVLVDKRQRKCPRDGYAWHRVIWEAFSERKDRDFLFRVDERGRAFRLYVLSPVAPVPPGWGAWQTKEIANGFLEHERYRFQLKANPTMRRASDKRRLGLFEQDRLRAWIERKAEAAGFEVEEDALAIGAPIEQRFFRSGRRGKHIAVDFQGILRVKDRGRFKGAFAKGIGSAKAFGFGLLVLQALPATK